MKHAMMVFGALALLMGGVQLSVAADGKDVYDKKCGSCHNKGLMGSVKLGDKAKLAELAKSGAAALEESVAKGKGKMKKIDIPAEDIKASVAYMLKSGE